MNKIKKIVFSLVSIIFVMITTVTTFAITQSDFNSKLASLRNQYPNYSVWNDYFDGGHQCWGFARLIAFNVYGSHVDQWPKVYTMSGVKAGDVIQYGNESGSGHTIFVTSVSGNTITYVDCNGNGNYSKNLWCKMGQYDRIWCKNLGKIFIFMEICCT